jgi:hypothetical protein
MAIDLKAKKVALNFPGGSLTATKGLLEAIFGPNLTGAGEQATVGTITVSGHSRTRVIGGPSTAVGGYSYTNKKYPTTVNGGASGGKVVMLLVGGKYWRARLNGSHQNFADFCTGASFFFDDAFFFKSERGKGFGPFGTDADLP